ncbi:hypothetical protein KV697_14055 [Sphingomonas sanguinis]|uniref:hypothetical protein n=1 Tax=Sphingomonas sanguinis TaxID=33051 RepID=UPI001C5A29E8|nr:hypothetical protein [Sphingomonas sanguinis]QXT34895.1 hypothetical protein KV697_14055 [Sphingomonas sanguinis]
MAHNGSAALHQSLNMLNNIDNPRCVPGYAVIDSINRGQERQETACASPINLKD